MAHLDDSDATALSHSSDSDKSLLEVPVSPQHLSSLNYSTLRSQSLSTTNYLALDQGKKHPTDVVQVIYLWFLRNIQIELWFCVSTEQETSSMLIIPILFSWFLSWTKMIHRSKWFIIKHVAPKLCSSLWGWRRFVHFFFKGWYWNIWDWRKSEKLCVLDSQSITLTCFNFLTLFIYYLLFRPSMKWLHGASMLILLVRLDHYTTQAHTDHIFQPEGYKFLMQNCTSCSVTEPL